MISRAFLIGRKTRQNYWAELMQETKLQGMKDRAGDPLGDPRFGLEEPVLCSLIRGPQHDFAGVSDRAEFPRPMPKLLDRTGEGERFLGRLRLTTCCDRATTHLHGHVHGCSGRAKNAALRKKRLTNKVFSAAAHGPAQETTCNHCFVLA